MELMRYPLPSSIAHFAIISFLGGIFSILMLREHRRLRAPVTAILSTAMVSGTIGYAITIFPLLFTRDLALYRVFKLSAEVLFAISLIMIGVTFLYLIGIKTSSRIGKYYIISLVNIGAISLIEFFAQIETHIVLSNDDMTMRAYGLYLLCHSLLTTPIVLFGVALLFLARTIEHTLSYIRITVLSIALILFGLNEIIPRLRAFFSNEVWEFSGSSIESVVIFIILAILPVVILFIPIFRSFIQRHSKEDDR